MSHLPGLMLYTSKYIDGDEAWRSACEETGKAVGSLTRVPFGTKERKAFETKFHGALTGYESYIDRIVKLGRSIHANDPAFKNDFWCKSLDFIEAQIPAILDEPRVLVHLDVANLHVQNGRFIGFFDFETCRIGSASLQLAASLPMLRASRTAWKLFRHGWELATNAVLDGDDLTKVSACSQLLGWRNISRNLSYDGTPPTGEGTKPVDPKPYKRVFEDVNELLLQNTAH
jgi:hypothetical protein